VTNPAETPEVRPSPRIASRRSALTSGLGFATAAGLSLFAVAGLALVAIAAPAGLELLQRSDPAGAWDSLGRDAQSNLIVAAAATGALGATSLLLFSILVGWSTGSAPGLGAETPMLSPFEAGRCWLRAIWRQLQIGVALVAPVVLVWLRWPIPGLILALVAIKITQRRFQDPFGWLLAPARHLPDLYYKLGPAGSVDSSLAWLWSISYRIAHGLILIAWLLPGTALVAAFTATWAGYDGTVPGWQMGSLGPAQLAVGVLAAGLVATIFGSVILLVPLSIGLARRQAERRRLGRSGRTGSRTAEAWRDSPRAVQPDRAFQRHDEQPAWPRASHARSENRIVERYPRAVGFDDSVSPLRYVGGLRG